MNENDLIRIEFVQEKNPSNTYAFNHTYIYYAMCNVFTFNTLYHQLRCGNVPFVHTI